MLWKPRIAFTVCTQGDFAIGSFLPCQILDLSKITSASLINIYMKLQYMWFDIKQFKC